MAPKRLGSYRLMKCLSDDKHNGDVYLAQDRKSKTLVVVKLPHESLSNQPTEKEEQKKQMLLYEADRLRLLNHPGIIRFIELNFEPKACPYFVMAYAPGGSLRQKYHAGTHLSLETIRSY